MSKATEVVGDLLFGTFVGVIVSAILIGVIGSCGARDDKVRCYERGGAWIGAWVKDGAGHSAYVECIRPPLTRINTDQRAK